MVIKEIVDDKMLYMDLLLLADEQEDMIHRYLEKGTMYVLDDNGVKAECIVTDEGNAILEIKNIAVKPEYQGCGYGKALINFLIHRYTGKYSIMQVKYSSGFTEGLRRKSAKRAELASVCICPDRLLSSMVGQSR